MTSTPRPTLLALLMLAQAGCLAYERVPGPQSARSHVKVGGDGLQLGDAQRPALSMEAYVRRTDDFLTTDQSAAARRWVERYPDIALDVLRTASSREASDRGVQAIARIFDDQCCRTTADAGWLALMRDRVSHPDRYVQHDAVRKQLLEHMRGGRFQDAANLHLAGTVKGTPSVALELDARQLAGDALIHANRPKEAVATLAQAMKLGRQSYPYQSAQLALLLSDAWRRFGNEAEAEAAWQGAVELAAPLLAQDHPVLDPALWDRLAGMRPVKTVWPAALAEHLARSVPVGLALLDPPYATNSSEATAPALTVVGARSSVSAGSTGDEATLWAAMGRRRLQRFEPQAALLAFKRAETFLTEKDNHGLVQLDQARALAQMDQRPAAIAILNRLADSPHHQVAQPALAVLGALLYKEGKNDQALALLKRAVEQDSVKDWPGRGEAEADLGLAYLTGGDDANGLRWLHAAQERFAKSKDLDQLGQCLENEAAYLEHVGRRQEASLVRQRAGG